MKLSIFALLIATTSISASASELQGEGERSWAQTAGSVAATAAGGAVGGYVGCLGGMAGAGIVLNKVAPRVLGSASKAVAAGLYSCIGGAAVGGYAGGSLGSAAAAEAPSQKEMDPEAPQTVTEALE